MEASTISRSRAITIKIKEQLCNEHRTSVLSKNSINKQLSRYIYIEELTSCSICTRGEYALDVRLHSIILSFAGEIRLKTEIEARSASASSSNGIVSESLVYSLLVCMIEQFWIF